MRQQFQGMTPNQRVIIVSHVPPGFFERDPYGPTFTNEFNDSRINDKYTDLVLEFGAKISAHIYGHTHTDSFRIFGGKSVAFVAPSVTPLVNNDISVNPSVRLYSYESGATYLTSYDQFSLDLGRANKDPSYRDWTKIYNFVEAYNVDDLSPAEMIKVFEMLKTDDATFKKYIRFNTEMRYEGILKI